MLAPLVSVNRTLTTAARCKRRVVVTGMGILCPLGVGVENSWNNLINCKSGITKLTDPDYDKLPCKIAVNYVRCVAPLLMH